VGEVPGFADNLLAVVGHGLPKSLHAVGVELYIDAHNRQPFQKGLGRLQAVKRVFVVFGQEYDVSCMPQFDGQ
jgi:hypothetical protein